MILVWLAIWQIASLIVHQPILLVGPVETIKALFLHALEPLFWLAIGSTMGRIATGLILGIVFGVLCSALGKKYSFLDLFFTPFITFLKSVPVASFVVLFLIWWSSKYLSVAISFCVVFPQIYIHTLEGLKNTDENLLEMARVFHMPVKNRIFYIYRPQLVPFLTSSVKISVGMAWKSGVAAEVISMGKHSIGGTLYSYKVMLDTAGILALTIVIILLSILFEKLTLCILAALSEWKVECQIPSFACSMLQEKEIVLEMNKVWKSYGKQLVLKGEEAVYRIGEIYYFREPSGKGKTTRFRLMAGLEVLDKGEIIKNRAMISYLFQEDRLCEKESAIKNLEMVCGNRDIAIKYLKEILPMDCLQKPCKEMSGGMKRRVAIARAFCVPSNLVLLDEPFNGLDEENQKLVKKAIDMWRKERCVLIASHLI